MSLITMPGRGWRGAVLGAMAIVALVACGGGTVQYEPFVPTRLVAFGDEASVLVPDPASVSGARKYSVNVVTTTNNVDTIDCREEPLWTQRVASFYGFVFAQCNPTGVAVPQAFTHAAPGARVDDLPAQVQKAGALGDKDLFMIMVGANDVLDLYKPHQAVAGGAVVAVPEDDIANELRARGRRLAERINEIVAAGPRVIVSTIPDLGLSPYARAQDALVPGRAAMLTRLITAFNEQLGVTIVLDGSLVGLVQADQMVQSMDRDPGNFNLTNARDAVCKDAGQPGFVLTDCTSKTLVTDGSSPLYLWADGTRMAFGGNDYLGQLAQQRAERNPF